MTREEAVRILDPETTRDELREYDADTYIEACNEACRMGADAIRAQQERENPKPLTLDELRQMDGELVWVQSPGVPEYGRWAIVEGVGENCLFLHDDFTCHDYGKTWLAYRQKPEEETL